MDCVLLFPRSLWSPAFQHALNQHPGGVFLLTRTMPIGLIRHFPPRWHSILSAWSRLRPHWDTDVTNWTIQDALSCPLTQTHSFRNPTGIRLVDVLTYDPATSGLALLSEVDLRRRFADAAPVRICAAVNRLRSPSDYIAYHLLQMLVSFSLPLPSLFPSPLSFVIDHLLVADTSVRTITTSSARHYLDTLERVPQALDWSRRAISRLAVPPVDIWQRIWRGPLLPRYRETHYKLIMNVLPLGDRLSAFAPERTPCHFCPSTRQTLRHFLFTCPLARQVWSDFRLLFHLPSVVSFRQALFSWSTGNSRFLGREHGYRLQAGHAVALHTLWTVHCRAVYSGIPTSPAAVSHLFRSLLRRHLTTLAASRFADRLGDLSRYLL
jgi:hypothetical protein